jgi:CheY-like chemotaxis protein
MLLLFSAGNIFLKSQPGEGSTFTFYVRAQLCPCPLGVKCTSEALSSQQVPSRTTKSLRHPARTVKAEEAPAGPSLQVLLTEDNLINQRLLRKQLMKAGCTVFVANDGVEALDFVREGKSSLDCILMGTQWKCLFRDCPRLIHQSTDIEMPKMSGLECAREIRRLNIQTPIIAVTANARSEQVKEVSVFLLKWTYCRLCCLGTDNRLRHGRCCSETVHDI